MRVLFADDDASSRLIAQTALRNLGHDCHTVTDGARAWEAFRSNRPDVVISDWTMPGLTGLELCRNIRAQIGVYAYFIMVTSHGALEDIREGMNAGVDDYLVKPLDTDDLATRLIAAARVSALHLQLANQRTQLEELNRELIDIARKDALTGLGNRRALEEDRDLLEARVARYGQRYCMALVDVDQFKSYNDRYGHQAGDQVLYAVATQLKDEARSGDAIYRYGGDEFLCLFPEQSVAAGSIAVERMRRGVERLSIPHADSASGVVTLSAGLAMLDAGHVRSVNDVIKEADEALYKAKQLGRNRVEHIAPEPASSAEREAPPAEPLDSRQTDLPSRRMAERPA
jgi:diguanylate cyclase (GGDEF)-like protein